jgi:hypothetical protein
VGTREASSATTAARDTGRLWVHTGIVEIDKRGGAIAGFRPSPPERVGAKLLHVNLIPGGSSRVLVSRQAVTNVGGWDLRAFQWPMGPVDPIGTDGLTASPGPLVAYRVQAGQSSADVDRVLTGAKVMRLDTQVYRLGLPCTQCTVCYRT